MDLGTIDPGPGAQVQGLHNPVSLSELRSQVLCLINIVMNTIFGGMIIVLVY